MTFLSAASSPSPEPDLDPASVEWKKKEGKDYGYDAFTYKSQMTVTFNSKKKLRTCAAALRVNLGYFRKHGPNYGIAHLLTKVIPRTAQSSAPKTSFEAFVTMRGGKVDTQISGDFTLFSFEVPRVHFESAIIFFGQLFVTPLLTEGAVLEAIEEVREETQGNVLKKGWRWRRLLAHLTNAKSAQQLFGIGSIVPPVPQAAVRARQAFHLNYTLPNLSLALAGESLPLLQKWVSTAFSGVSNEGVLQSPIQESFYTAKELGKVVFLKAAAPWEMHIVILCEDNLLTRPDRPLILLNHFLESPHAGSFRAALNDAELGDLLATECNVLSASSSQYIVHLQLWKRGRSEYAHVCQLFFDYFKVACYHIQTHHFLDVKRWYNIALQCGSGSSGNDLVRQMLNSPEMLGDENAQADSESPAANSEGDFVNLLKRFCPEYATVIISTNDLSGPTVKETALDIEYTYLYLRDLPRLKLAFNALLPPPVYNQNTLAELRRISESNTPKLEVSPVEPRDITPFELETVGRLLCDTCYDHKTPVIAITFDVYIAQTQLGDRVQKTICIFVQYYMRRRLAQLSYRLYIANVIFELTTTWYGMTLTFRGPAPAVKSGIKELFPVFAEALRGLSLDKEFNLLFESVEAYVQERLNGTLRDYEENFWEELCHQEFLFAPDVKDILDKVSPSSIAEILDSYQNSFIEAIATGWITAEEAIELFKEAVRVLATDLTYSVRPAAQVLSWVKLPTFFVHKISKEIGNTGSIAAIYFYFGNKQIEEPFAQILHALTETAFCEYLRKINNFANTSYSTVINDRGFMFFKLAVESFNIAPLQIFSYVEQFLGQQLNRLANITEEEFELAKSAAQHKHIRNFSNLYERHACFLKDMRAHQSASPSAYVAKKLNDFTSKELNEKFDKLIIRNPQILHLVIPAVSLYEATEARALEFVLNANVAAVTAMDDFRAHCNKYPDHHSVYTMTIQKKKKTADSVQKS